MDGHTPHRYGSDLSHVRLRVWDDEAVAYDIRTGETHLLSEEAAAAVSSLAGRELSLDALAAILEERLTPEQGTLTEHLQSLLNVLWSYGLVERHDR